MKGVEKEYIRYNVVEDKEFNIYMAVGHRIGFGNSCDWIGKDLVTNIPVIFCGNFCCNENVTAAALGLKKGKLIIASFECITKNEALEKLEKLSKSEEDVRNYKNSIEAIKPRYVEIVNDYIEKTNAKAAEEKRNDKQLTKRIKKVQRTLRNINR